MNELTSEKKGKKTYTKPEITQVELIPDQVVLGTFCSADASCNGVYAVGV